MADDVTVTLLSLVSTKVIFADLLPEDNTLVVKGRPVYDFPSITVVMLFVVAP